MKRLMLFLTAAIMILCSCENVEPNDPQKNIDEALLRMEPYVNFTYKVVSPRCVVFTYCSSSNINYFTWNFGDGAYDSKNQGTSHMYKDAGEYEVELTGQKEKNGTIYRCKKKVKLSNPKDICIQSFTFESIPYEGKYYRVYMYDDDWFGNSWELKSYYTLHQLTFNNLPFTMNLLSDKVMDKLSGDNYYNVVVYYNNSRSGDGTQCYKGKLYKSSILEYYPRYRFSNSNITFTIDMAFTY